MEKKNQLEVNQLAIDLNLFFQEIEPYVEKNTCSLHQLFEYSHKEKDEWYQCLSRLWNGCCGKQVLKSVFREIGRMSNHDGL